MQTFVAYAAASSLDATPSAVDAASARVEAHYRSLNERRPRRRELIGPSCGVVLWESDVAETIWPLWVQRAGRCVASGYPPLGVEAVTSAATEHAPFALVDALVERHDRILELTPPFVCAAADVEADSLDLFTDALGVGRLFEVRTPTGWVWSNRPFAALLFADAPVLPDPTGWAQSAVADEFFGVTTPLQGVRAVGAGTRIAWDGRRGRLTVSAVDLMTSLLVPDPDQRLDDLIEEAAADLTARTASIARWYPGTPVVDLSGGRDSRLVAASFLAGGTPVELHSHDGVPGDLSVAQELVGLLGRDVPHRITHMPTGTSAPRLPFAAMASARAWHAYAEGLRPCSYLHYTAPGSLDRVGSVVVGGVGGEVAHGFYYAGSDDLTATSFADEWARAMSDPVDAHRAAAEFARRVVQRHCPVPGVTTKARESLVAHLAGVVQSIREAGVPGPTVLDHLYVAERMRRWGSTGERSGVCSPLLTPSFQRAALALRPHQRRGNTLHRMLTERLVPSWAGVPYFPGEMPKVASAPKPAAPRVIRVAECTDADEVEAVLATPDAWGYPFDPTVIARYWHASASGETSAAQERILRSAVWRAAFADVTADLGGRPRPERSGRVPAPETSAATIDPTTVPTTQQETRHSVGAAPTAARPEATSPSGLREAAPAPTPTLTAVLLQTQAVKRIGRSTAWAAVRDTPPGRGVRRYLARRR